MARKVRDASLESRDARHKLKARDRLYVRAIDRGLHLGYRRQKSGPGTWWARHYLGNRQYQVEKLGLANDNSDADGVNILDFWQAQQKARERKLQRTRVATAPLTVRQAIDLYLKHKEDEGRDILDARCRADAHIIRVLGDRECAELTTDEIRTWHRNLAKAEPRRRPGNDTGKEAVRKRQASANRVLTILKAALNHVFNEGKVPSDAAWRKVKPFRGVTAARTRYLSIAEAKRLINACEPDFRPLVQAALQTGARYGQLARLIVSDNNPDAGTLRLTTRKGDGTEKVYHATLTEEGVAFFHEITAGRAGSELMFRNVGRIERAIELERERRQKAGQPVDNIVIDDAGDWRESEQKRPMDDAVKRAKIKPPIGFHGLRHTWASHSVMNGVPLLVVARNLGHSDTRMVEKHYGHLAPSYEAKAIRAGAPKFGFKSNTKVATLAARA